MSQAAPTEFSSTEPIGFVTCVAGRKRDRQSFTDSDQLYAGVLRLRRLGNTSPVAAFHVDNEVAGEDAEKLRDSALAPLRLVDAAEVAWPSDWNATRGRLQLYRSYYCLCFAVLHSPFEATMLMNADTLLSSTP